MKRLELTDDLISGVPDIDGHHRALFENGNKLLFPEDGKGDARSQRDVLLFLCGYVHYHFAAEEAVMKNAGLDPGKHIEQHERMRQKLAEIRQSEQKSGMLDEHNKSRLYILLDEWFSNHILYWDMKLAEELKIKLKEPSLPSVEEVSKKGVRKKGVWDDLNVNDIQVSKIKGWLSQAEIRARNRLK